LLVYFHIRLVTWVMEAGLILEGFLRGIVPTINCEDVAVVTSSSSAIDVELSADPSKVI